MASLLSNGVGAKPEKNKQKTPGVRGGSASNSNARRLEAGGAHLASAAVWGFVALRSRSRGLRAGGVFTPTLHVRPLLESSPAFQAVVRQLALQVCSEAFASLCD